MQPTDSYNVSRRALDVEDYIDILRRHKSWIFGPFLFCLVASVVGAFLWPDSYVSEARIKIAPQQVSESMVQSTTTAQIWDRISSMQQSIVNRATLTNIIQTKKLYPRQVASKPLEDVIDEMRKDIRIEPIASAGTTSHLIPAFSIRFQYQDKYLAQSVVADLMSKFIEQNMHDMEGRAYSNVRFMKDETERAKKELDDIGNQLTEFQMQNQGKLPDQADSNLRSMMAMESTLNSLNSSISRANTEKLTIEAAIKSVQDQKQQLGKLYSDAPTAISVQRNDRLLEAERDVQRLEDNLRILKQKYTENHPDIQSTMALLKAAQQKKEELQKEDDQKKDEQRKEDAAKTAKGDNSRVNPQLVREQMGADARIQGLQASAAAKEQEIEDLQKQIKRTNDEIKTLEGRLSTMPLGMKQYTDLMRDREAAKAKFLQLDENLSKAQRSQDMEQSNQGERLEPLDTASLPTDPTEPKRPLVISIGAGVGLLLGIVIAGAREMKDTSLKNLKDVRAYTQMAVLGSIPLLENDFVVRRRRRLAWLGWTTACLVAVVVMVGAIVYYEAAARGGGQ